MKSYRHEWVYEENEYREKVHDVKGGHDCLCWNLEPVSPLLLSGGGSLCTEVKVPWQASGKASGDRELQNKPTFTAATQKGGDYIVEATVRLGRVLLVYCIASPELFLPTRPPPFRISQAVDEQGRPFTTKLQVTVSGDEKKDQSAEVCSAHHDPQEPDVIVFVTGRTQTHSRQGLISARRDGPPACAVRLLRAGSYALLRPCRTYSLERSSSFVGLFCLLCAHSRFGTRVLEDL